MNNAILRAMQILEYLTYTAKGGERISEIARQLDMPKSSAFEILESLEELGYLGKNGKLYQTGEKLSHLGLSSLENSEVLEITRKHLEELTKETGFTSIAGITVGSDMLVTDKVTAMNTMPIICGIGTKHPAHITAIGKAILSCYKDTEILKMVGSSCYVSYTKNSLGNPKQLLRNISEIRKNGFAIENFEENVYIYGIAAPVINRNGQVCEAIGISAFQKDIENANRQQIAQAVMNCAQSIMNELK